VVEPLLGWRGVLWICAVLSAIAACVLFVAQRRASPSPTQPFQPVVALQRYVALFRLPAARVLYAAVAIEGGLIFGSFPHFAPLLTERGLGGTAEAGLALAAFGCGGFLYAAIVALVLRVIGQGNMVRLGGGLAGLALIGMAFAWTEALFIGCALFLGTGFFMIHNTIQVRASELAPQARASGLAMHSFSFFLGQTIGPALMGLALATMGSALSFIWVGLAIFALGCWLSLTSPGTTREQAR
jgi:predicted MFS family arabinose efflux permease